MDYTNPYEINDLVVEAGAAYVFKLQNEDIWKEVAYLEKPDPQKFDYFGGRVSIAGSTIAVSAWGERGRSTGVNGDPTVLGRPAAGAVYLYENFSNDEWRQVTYVKAPNTDTGDSFGIGLSMSEDVLVISSPYEDSQATGIDGDQADNNFEDSGATYLYTRDGSGNWAFSTYLKASNTGAGDRFGWGVALDGTTVVIAAPDEDSNATGVNSGIDNNGARDSGAVYVFQ